MRVSVNVDHAVCAALELTAAPEAAPFEGERIAAYRGIPRKFLDTDMQTLRQAGAVAWR